ALLQVGRAFRHKRRPVSGPVLVSGTDQLHRAGQALAFGAIKYLHLDNVGQERQRNGQQRRPGRPTCGGRGSRWRFLPGGHVDFNAELDVGFREVARWQQRVDLRGQVRCPGVVKSVPVATCAERRLEVILQRHVLSSSPAVPGASGWYVLLTSAPPETP